jgi:paraquat-inducible protein B
MNMEKTDEFEVRGLPQARIKRQPRVSIIWIVPLAAAIAGGWLVFKYVRQMGPVISIQFSDGNEIKANQTTLQYRGARVGGVLSVKLTHDLEHVEVQARLDKSAESLARDGTVWKPSSPALTFKCSRAAGRNKKNSSARKSRPFLKHLTANWK